VKATRVNKVAWVVIGGLMLLTASCFSGTPASATSTTESEASLAAKYLADVGIADRPYAQWQAAIVGKTTQSEFVVPAST
jgi:hypothetical protein